MQPLMNMITFSARSREEIIRLHAKIIDAMEACDGDHVDRLLAELAAYTSKLGAQVMQDRAAKETANTSE